jgi:plastocyanin
MVGRLLVAAVVAGTAALPALAAQEKTITAYDLEFRPTSVEIVAGESVTLDNAQGTHNFAFADQALPGSPQPAGSQAWTPPPRKTFNTPGRYDFFCQAHPDEMTGTVVVLAPPSATPTPTATPPPQPQPQPGTTAPLKLRELRMLGGPFCRRGGDCRRPGARLRIDLSAAAHVRGRLKRRGRAAQAVDLGTIAAGPRTVRFGRRLAAGRYTLRLWAGDLDPRTLRFRMIAR